MTTIELRERALFALPSSLLICLVIILLRIGPPLAIIVITLAYFFTNNTGTTVTTTNSQDIITEIAKVVDAFNGLAMSLNSTTVAETNKILAAFSSLSSAVTTAIANFAKTQPTTFEYNGRNYLPLAIHTSADTVSPVSGDAMVPTFTFGTPVVYRTAVVPQSLICNNFTRFIGVTVAPLIAGNIPPTTFLSSDAPTDIDLTEDSATEYVVHRSISRNTASVLVVATPLDTLSRHSSTLSPTASSSAPASES